LVHQNLTDTKEGLQAGIIAEEGDRDKRNIVKSRFVFGVARKAERIRRRNEEDTIAATLRLRPQIQQRTPITGSRTAAVPFKTDTKLLIGYRHGRRKNI